MDKPTLFVGSSKEALEYANAIESKLQDVASVTVWTKDVLWTPGAGTLENLIEILPGFDFAALILTADDLTISRGGKDRSPRDNMIFELGLFMGHLGRFRTFFLCDTRHTLKIPSDLKGITYVPFEGNPRDVDSAVARACGIMRTRIGTQGLPRLFHESMVDRIKLSSWDEIYARAIKLVGKAELRVRATSFGTPTGLDGLKSEYIESLARKAAEQKGRNVKFRYNVVCSQWRTGPQRDIGLLARQEVFRKYEVLDCLEVREIEGSGRVDILIVDDNHLHVSFQGLGDRSLAFGLQLEDAYRLVRPIVAWYDECLFDKATPIGEIHYAWLRRLLGRIAIPIRLRKSHW